VRRLEMIATPFSADPLDVVPGVEATLEAVSPAPTLITEQQVAFATAAAVPVWSPTVRWWAKAIHAVRAAASSTLRTSRADARRPRSNYPQRSAYLENARMAREMERL
jgi:hypothetical protein